MLFLFDVAISEIFTPKDATAGYENSGKFRTCTLFKPTSILTPASLSGTISESFAELSSVPEDFQWAMAAQLDTQD